MLRCGELGCERALAHPRLKIHRRRSDRRLCRFVRATEPVQLRRGLAQANARDGAIIDERAGHVATNPGIDEPPRVRVDRELCLGAHEPCHEREGVLMLLPQLNLRPWRQTFVCRAPLKRRAHPRLGTVCPQHAQKRTLASAPPDAGHVEHVRSGLQDNRVEPSGLHGRRHALGPHRVLRRRHRTNAIAESLEGHVAVRRRRSARTFGAPHRSRRCCDHACNPRRSAATAREQRSHRHRGERAPGDLHPPEGPAAATSRQRPTLSRS